MISSDRDKLKVFTIHMFEHLFPAMETSCHQIRDKARVERPAEFVPVLVSHSENRPGVSYILHDVVS